MTDGQLLLLIMALVYAGECLVWLPKSAYACLRSIGRNRRLKSAPANFSSSRGGWILADPFPTLGTVFIARSWPVCLNAEGVVAFSIESPNPGIRPESLVGDEYLWKDVESITRDGKRILINQKPFAVESTPEAAFQLRHFLFEIWKSHSELREPKIQREVQRNWNPRRLQKIIRFWEGATRPLRGFCNLLLLLLFGGIPACLIFFGASWELLIVGVSSVVAMIVIASIFFALHRRLYPKLVFERMQWFFLILLVPQQSVRALDLLFKAAVAGAHPLAVADFSIAENSEQRRTFMGKVYRDLCFPLQWKDKVDQTSGKIISDFRDQFLLPEIEKFRRLHKNEIKDWSEPDQEEGEESYCPRCFEKFSSDKVKKCQDCGGISVVKWQKKTV